MKGTKKWMAAVLVMVLLLSNTLAVSAAEANNQTKASYDMSKGGTQTFTIVNEDGEETEITVEEVTGVSRVSNGSYKITCSTSNWTAGYYITVSGNEITKAYSPFYSTVRGSISNSVLLRSSTVKVTYAFIFKLALFSFSTGVITEIVDNELVVSQK